MYVADTACSSFTATNDVARWRNGAAVANRTDDIQGPLIDRFGRVHTNLRISVTDRCNIRCFYCMPNEHVQFKPRHEILTFEEIERFVRVVVRLGVNRCGSPVASRWCGRTCRNWCAC